MSTGEFPDFPACWSWPALDEGRKAAYFARWPDDADFHLLREWHEGRCAICGRVPQGATKRDRLYQDHDYDTGLTRGWLCPSCNTLEGLQPGSSAAPAIVRYRERPPAAILGFAIRYVNIFGETPVRPPRASWADLERALESLPRDE